MLNMPFEVLVDPRVRTRVTRVALQDEDGNNLQDEGAGTLEPENSQ